MAQSSSSQHQHDERSCERRESEDFLWPPPVDGLIEHLDAENPSSQLPVADVPQQAPPVSPPAPRTGPTDVKGFENDIGSPASVSLSELSSAPLYDWQDGLLIVLQLVDQFSVDGQEPAGTFPTIDRIALAPSGFLLAQLETQRGEPLAGAGRLLRQLLGAVTLPPSIRLLMMQAASTRPALSFRDCVSQLRNYDRPNRVRHLAELFERFQRGDVQLAPSPRILSESPAQVPGVSAEPSPRPARLSALKILRATAAGVLIGGAAFALLAGGSFFVSRLARATTPAAEIPQASAEQPPAAEAPSIAQQPPAPTAAAGLPTVRRTPRQQPRAASSATAPAPAVPRTRPVAPEAARPVARTQTPPPPPAQPVVQPVETSLANLTLAETSRTSPTSVLDSSGPPVAFLQEARDLLALGLATAGEARAAIAESGEQIAYTAVDEDVIQPVPLTTLPIRRAADASGDQVGILELVIDTRGRVETARFVGTAHFRDRWLISAAKAWLFKPATKNGQPVKFLKRIEFQRS